MKLSLNTDFTKFPRAVSVAPAGSAPGEVAGKAVLAHDERHLRRRAVELADHAKTRPAAGTGETVRDGTARRGCPHGCELGTHEHPCPYATGDDRIGRIDEDESEAS